ncbi:MAG: IclR family transcriptional regulator [Pseudomonadota bacterium]
MTAAGGIQVINRAAQILRQLKHDNSGQSLGTIAMETGLPRSTVQRIVNALAAEALVTTSGKNGDLRLGPEIQSLAAAGRIDVLHALRPKLEGLSDVTGETVDLARFQVSHMTFIDQVAGRHRLRAVSIPGEDFPLTTTANGKAALSLLPDDDVVDLYQGEVPDEDASLFLDEISRARNEGLAFDLDEHTVGISAVGAAFQTVSHEIYAVSIPAPTQRFDQKRAEIEAALLRFMHETIAGDPNFVQSERNR